MRRRLLSLAAFLAGAGLIALVAPSDAVAVQDPKPDAEEFVVTNWGKPKEFEKGKPARHWIWYENKTWHYRTTSAAGDTHRFAGQIDVIGGALLANPVGLNGEAKKNDKNADHFRFEKTWIKTLFTTAGGVDGLNFTVDEKATHVKFDLRVDAKSQPGLIAIGKAGEHPKEAVFKLPAHPPEPVTEPKKKKKK